LAGFIQADGHFGCMTKIAKDTKLGKQVLLHVHIDIAQHIKSIIVLEQIKSILGVGTIYINNKTQMAHLKIQGIQKANLFIKHFGTTKLYGAKELDFLAYCKIVGLMNEKNHLTEKGLAQIETIIGTMNSKRTNFNYE
jgi:hypothetical protein